MAAIDVQITLPLDVIQGMNDRSIQSAALMARAFRRAMQPIGRRVVRALSTEPPKPTYPLRWRSQAERRKVMAKLRAEGKLPYPRTHELAKGWRYSIEALADGGAFSISNPVDYAPRVQGDLAEPMFLDIGWPQAAPILSAAMDEAEEAAIQTWWTIVSPTAGIPY